MVNISERMIWKRLNFVYNLMCYNYVIKKEANLQ